MLKMPESLKSSHSLLLAIICGLVSGAIAFFVLGVSYDYAHLTVDTKISLNFDPFDVVSLLVTIGLAVYITRVLQRKDDENKTERSLLSGYFTDFAEEFSQDIHKLTSADSVESAEVASVFQKHGMALQELLDLAKSHASHDDEKLENLEDVVSKVRDLLSDLPRDGAVEDGVRIDGTKIIYSRRHLADITASMGRFKKAIFGIVCGIIRYK